VKLFQPKSHPAHALFPLSLSLAVLPASQAFSQAMPAPAMTDTNTPTAKPIVKPGAEPTQVPKDAAHEEVTVIGTRSRPLQHESLPSTVFTQKEIQQAGITTPQDFMRLTPGVALIEGNIPADSQITIRGISQTYSPTAETPAGIIVDGVPLTAPSDFNQSLVNLQTIEVLKGPQNAIYGRNAVAGAVVINTLPPPEVWQYALTAGASNGAGARGILNVGGPLIPGLVTANVVASEDHSDGFYKDITTGDKIDRYDNQSLNGRVYITPTPDLTIDIKAGWIQMYGGGLAWHGQCPCSPYYVGKIPDVNNVSEPYVADIPNVAHTEKRSVSARVSYDMTLGSIQAVSSYNYNQDVQYGSLYPYIPAPLGKADGTQAAEYISEAYFEELKFVSSPARLRYQFGADYYDITRDGLSSTGVTYDHIQYGSLGPFPANSDNPTLAFADDVYHTKAWELFAESTFDITPHLTLDGAIRYSRNDITDQNEAPAQFTLYPGELRAEAYSKAEPRITLTYKFTPLINVYADWALGSLPGGFNPTGSSTTVHAIYPDAPVADIYKQESSRNYEVGFNSQFLDRRVTLNGAVYYNLLFNQQYNIYYPAASIETIDSIDKVRNYGGEVSIEVIPAPHWNISLGYGIINSKIVAFAADPTAVGNRPPYVPEYNLSFALQRNFQINDKISGFARFDDSVKGTEYWEADNLIGARSDVINVANARVGIDYGHFNVTAFVKNLADNRYNQSNVVLTNDVLATYLAPPRVYGIEVTARY
jgi:iron complex outermembrane receptor protein